MFYFCFQESRAFSETVLSRFNLLCVIWPWVSLCVHQIRWNLWSIWTIISENKKNLEIKSKQIISNDSFGHLKITFASMPRHGLFRNVILCTHYYASKRQNSFLALYWPSSIKSYLTRYFFQIGEFQTLFRKSLKKSNLKKSHGHKLLYW